MPKMLVCGVVNWDVTLFAENLPRPGEEVQVGRVIAVPGGKGGNTAVAAARILGPSKVGLVAMLGCDEIADRQTKILEKEGVDTSCIMKQEGVASGQAYVLVDSTGEDMILTHAQANKMMNAKHVTGEPVASAIKQSSMMVIIDPPLEVAVALAEQGRKQGKTVVWSPALLSRHGFSVLSRHMDNVDYLILNEHEAMMLAGANDGQGACAELSRRLGGKKVVTTLGKIGCVFCWDGKKALVPAMDLALFGLKTISTVGAGDTFVGAFAAYRLQGLDDVDSIFMASIAAALKTTREETRASPTGEEIKRYAGDERMTLLRRRITVT